jgi:lysophospholipase L1-like esterase
MCRHTLLYLIAAIVLVTGGTATTFSQEKVIVAFGDSTTARRDEDGVVVYATLLERELHAKNVSAKIINAGVPGNTTADARARFDKDVLAQKPGLVIIQFGLNDAAVDVWKSPPATRSRVSRDDYEKNLRYFVRTLKNHRSQVILMTPNACRWTSKILKLYGKLPYQPDNPDGFNVIVKDYAKTVARVAEQEHVPLIDIFEAFQAYAKKPGQSMDGLLVDGMHPSGKGQQLVAELLLDSMPLRKLCQP